MLSAAVACRPGSPRQPAVLSGVDSGRELVIANGCGSCHAISGIPNGDGSIGPPLTGLATRSYIAGVLPNTPQNLAAWIRAPEAFKPGVAMPDVGLSARESDDIASFLYSRY